MADTNQQRIWTGINDESKRKAEKGRGKVACPLYLPWGFHPVFYSLGKKLRFLLLALLLFGFMGIFHPSTAHAGKGAYPELINKISYDTLEILKKHGMSIQHEMIEKQHGMLVHSVREQPWFRSDAATGRYTLLFFQADEIPLEAKLEVIRYCMELYEERGSKERFRIIMHREAFKPEIPFFSGRKPFFQLTIGGNN